MKAKVLNFRGGRHTQYTNQLLITLKDVSSRKSAAPFIGKKVAWKTRSGKKLVGKIASPHGNSGALRARFPKGLPGEILGKEIEVLE